MAKWGISLLHYRNFDFQIRNYLIYINEREIYSHSSRSEDGSSGLCNDAPTIKLPKINTGRRRNLPLNQFPQISGADILIRERFLNSWMTMLGVLMPPTDIREAVKYVKLETRFQFSLPGENFPLSATHYYLLHPWFKWGALEA